MKKRLLMVLIVTGLVLGCFLWIKGPRAFSFVAAVPGQGANISDADIQQQFITLIDAVNMDKKEFLLQSSDVAGVEELKRIFGKITLGDGFGGKELEDLMAKCDLSHAPLKCFIFHLGNKQFHAKNGHSLRPYTYKVGLEFGGPAVMTLSFPAVNGKLSGVKIQKIEVFVPYDDNVVEFTKLKERLNQLAK